MLLERDGFPCTEVYAFATWYDILIIGTSGLFFCAPDGSFIGYDVRDVLDFYDALQYKSLDMSGDELWGGGHNYKGIRILDLKHPG